MTRSPRLACAVALLACAAIASAAERRPPVVKTGSLLVATVKTRDPDFARSVVIVVYSSPEAAVGIFINRPRSGEAWIGGPVAIGANALVNTRVAPPHSRRVLPDVYLVPNPERLPDAPHRIYSGTCGWTARQFLDEQKRGLWRVIPGTAELVFDAQPDSLWDRLNVR